MWFTRLAILRPILIGMLFAAFVVLGLRSMGSIPAELNPRVEIPTLLVTTVFPGAGPEEVENLISKPLEDSVATVSRVKDIFSSSQENLSVVTLDFNIGTPLDEALAAVRERVEAAKLELPDGAHSPVVSKLDLNALPVMTISLTGGDNAETLRTLAENQVKYYLDRVPGVASVQVRGGAQREIQVAVERDRLQTYGMSLSDVMNSLRAASINVPAGNISDGAREYGVRAVGEFNSLDAIRNVPLALPPSGSSLAALGGGATLSGMQMPPATPGTPLTLGEIATVRDTVAAPDTITRMDGQPSVSLVINKAADANTVQIADGVRRVLSRVKSELPPGVRLVVDQDQSQLVRGALEDVNSSLFLGALLAILVVYLFLHNLRGTAIVSIAIPVSIISTFLVMWAAGFTFNQMTLLGLSLSVGILVDDSILVLESIYRHLHGGEMPRDAAFNGRNEISMADITNTLVDVVVFIPIAFMGGIVGQFFREFGVVVASASLFSLLVSLSLTPMLASRLYRQDEALEARGGIFARFDRFYHSLDASYRRLLIMALHRRPLVIGGGVLALLLSGVLAWRALAFEFIPPFDQSRISVSMTLPAGSSLAATDALLRQVEDTARKIPEVVHWSAEAGSISAGFGTLTLQGPQYGQVTLTLREKQGLADRVLHPFGGGPARRTRSDDVIAAELREALADLYGARIAVAAAHGWSGDTKPLELQLHGSNLEQLEQSAGQIRDLLQRTPGILNPTTSISMGRPEVQVHLDRDRAAQVGVLPAMAAVSLRDSIAGNTEVKYRGDGRETTVRVQLDSLDRHSPEDVSRVIVGHTGNRPVTLADIADVRMGIGPTQIDRKNRLREISISADLAPGCSLGNLRGPLQKDLERLTPEGASLRWGGEAEEMVSSARAMLMALLLAALLAYMLMAALFNSLLHPFTILLSLPMALVGAILALVLLHESLSIVSMIGVIMLVGLVSKNAILLVDYTNTLRSRGLPRNTAILEAGPTRLRPILMTTLSTVIAMLPVALRFGRASEMRAPMAVAVIGGLILSTLLTLVVIPVAYTYLDDLTARLRR